MVAGDIAGTAVKLPRSGPPVLACGAWLKNTVCVTQGDEAFVSRDIGDLDSMERCMALEETALHLLDRLNIAPRIMVHDVHPDFFSSRFAARLAAERDIPVLAVQHHHAHIAAVMAEHGIEQPVLGLALDGVGLGSDGTAWGGELLCVDSIGGFSRLGHLQQLALAGGDRAAREPWRMAASVLHALGRGEEIVGRFRQPAATMVTHMLATGLNAPMTSSAGRWFDAAAGLLGVIDVCGFEAQAAIALEKLAQQHGPVAPSMDGFVLDPDGCLNLLPLMDTLAETRDAAYGAALFHATLIEALAQWLEAASRQTGLTTAALGGGCFLNAILSRELPIRLNQSGMRVLQARQVPPNDGAISLGQAWVAMQSGVATCV